MGLLDNNTQIDYYQGSDLGNYQFVSLEDIINQFMFIYVGEEKVVNKIGRTDVAFWAQRALAELSFDTFKSVKAQQIDLPASLTMILPHDYVNYTQLSWVDTAGIKHPLYSTTDTSNPFEIRQHTDGTYDFPEQYELIYNNSFSSDFDFWEKTGNAFSGSYAGSRIYNLVTLGTGSKSEIDDGVLTFTNAAHSVGNEPNGRAQAVWQEIDVSGVEYIDISANATSTAPVASTWTVSENNPYASDNTYTYTQGSNTYGPEFYYAGNSQLGIQGSTNSFTLPETIVRVGVSTKPGDTRTTLHDSYAYVPYNPTTQQGDFYGGQLPSANGFPEIFDIDYLEWKEGDTGYKYKTAIDVRAYEKIYVLITSTAFHTEYAWGEDFDTITTTSTVDDISVKNYSNANNLQHPIGVGSDSSTWNSYKSSTPSENNNDDYEDDTYWPNQGERYGLDPQRSQINGSFYIDNLKGKINFSSNISGKTVILDYISDSLGTDGEMQVHKFAEDAMYKHILCGVMSSRANVGRGQLAYYKKDKFAATRQAKLRLSNIKFKEITQVLRGKSKQIKH